MFRSLRKNQDNTNSFLPPPLPPLPPSPPPPPLFAAASRKDCWPPQPFLESTTPVNPVDDDDIVNSSEDDSTTSVDQTPPPSNGKRENNVAPAGGTTAPLLSPVRFSVSQMQATCPRGDFSAMNIMSRLTKRRHLMPQAPSTTTKPRLIPSPLPMPTSPPRELPAARASVSKISDAKPPSVQSPQLPLPITPPRPLLSEFPAKSAAVEPLQDTRQSVSNAPPILSSEKTDIDMDAHTDPSLSLQSLSADADDPLSEDDSAPLKFIPRDEPADLNQDEHTYTGAREGNTTGGAPSSLIEEIEEASQEKKGGHATHTSDHLDEPNAPWTVHLAKRFGTIPGTSLLTKMSAVSQRHSQLKDSKSIAPVSGGLLERLQMLYKPATFKLALPKMERARATVLTYEPVALRFCLTRCRLELLSAEGSAPPAQPFYRIVMFAVDQVDVEQGTQFRLDDCIEVSLPPGQRFVQCRKFTTLARTSALTPLDVEAAVSHELVLPCFGPAAHALPPASTTLSPQPAAQIQSRVTPVESLQPVSFAGTVTICGRVQRVLLRGSWPTEAHSRPTSVLVQDYTGICELALPPNFGDDISWHKLALAGEGEVFTFFDVHPLRCSPAIAAFAASRSLRALLTPMLKPAARRCYAVALARSTTTVRAAPAAAAPPYCAPAVLTVSELLEAADGIDCIDVRVSLAVRVLRVLLRGAAGGALLWVQDSSTLRSVPIAFLGRRARTLAAMLANQRTTTVAVLRDLLLSARPLALGAAPELTFDAYSTVEFGWRDKDYDSILPELPGASAGWSCIARSEMLPCEAIAPANPTPFRRTLLLLFQRAVELSRLPGQLATPSPESLVLQQNLVALPETCITALQSIELRSVLG
eukprot:TRINITY_DN2193_c0_g2_i5.p1 TRINITY_DN2193_c0_g2~~TRINITY_DN2193_c0_g2_i5.p1  ORF type:complete len:869 (-),score=131.76 TRINITY_DN2193_c0_g2_i5:413-3019(-)